MMIMIRMMLLAGMLLCCVSPAFGEYYQYRDADGVLRFTDDLASIPPDQRPDVKTHQSVVSPPASQENNTAALNSADGTDTSPEKGSQPSGDTWQGRNNQRKQELDQMQADLKKTYETLQAERSSLGASAPPDNASFQEKAAYNQRVEALNDKIAVYEAQLDSFNEQVQAYNAQVKQ